MIPGYAELSAETRRPLDWLAATAGRAGRGQILGLPGTGKTWLIAKLRELWGLHAKWRSIVVAIGATAARLSEGGVTIRSFRTNPRGITNAATSLIIIDEVGMCGKTDFEAILGTYPRATIVWIGDPFQFDPVGDDPFVRSAAYVAAWKADRIACFTLTTFRRYTGAWAPRLGAFITDVTARPAGWKRRAHAFVHELASRRGGANAAKPGVRLVATRAQVREINERRARAMAAARGEALVRIETTDPKTRRAVTLSFLLGQTVIVKRNQLDKAGNYTAANGERALLAAVTAGVVTKSSAAKIVYDDGTEVTIPAYAVDHRYDLPIRSAEGALTVHAMQGATARAGSIVIDVADMRTFPHLFVAMTRAADPGSQLAIKPFDPAMLDAVLGNAPAWKFEFAAQHASRAFTTPK